MKRVIISEEKFNILKNTLRISEEQEKFLEENKELLTEYSQVSNPKKDNVILGDTQIWIYGNDRHGFTPHCHMFNTDKTVEIEISLIDFSIVNVKTPKNVPSDWGKFKEYKNKFFKWLKSTESRGKTCLNQKMLYILWDVNNPKNTLSDYVFNHGIKEVEDELAEYILEEDS